MPFCRLIQNLKAPFTMTRARNRSDKPSSSSSRSSWNPSNNEVRPPPRMAGQSTLISKNDAVASPWAKARPVIASLTMRFGRSRDAK